jgi:hypothetical protein
MTPPTTSCRRGDVVLVPFPFTDLSTTKQRPALVVSPDAWNATQPDVMLIAITSQMAVAAGPQDLVLTAPMWPPPACPNHRASAPLSFSRCIKAC